MRPPRPSVLAECRSPSLHNCPPLSGEKAQLSELIAFLLGKEFPRLQSLLRLR